MKNIMSHKKRIIPKAFVAIAFLMLNSNLFAQTYPDSLKVPVTFYDYHPNGSNPEFQPKNAGAKGYNRVKNMVLATLNGPPGSGKPARGPSPFFNCDIDKWFRPYPSTPRDSTIPAYLTPSATYGCGQSRIKLTNDTAFINKVIRDSLVFRYIPSTLGTYTFDAPSFFPLDTLGFKKEIADGSMRTHNFSFAMELHWQFTMAPGLKFYFRGDDDVWVFINGNLEMDIGGIHDSISDSIIVDNLGLTIGQKYWFDFFYCERCVTASSIRITSNIISATPSSIEMEVKPPADTIRAGDSIEYTASIKDQGNNEIHDYDNALKWTLTPTGTASYLKKTNGLTNTFYGIDAYYTYYIKASLDTVTNLGIPVHKLWLDTVYVRPGPPTHLFIEANADSMVSLRDSARMGSTIISSSTLTDSVYAILRDKYGNWVSHATIAKWLSRDESVVTVASGRTQLGEGVLTRITAIKDTTVVLARDTVLNLKDSLRVFITDVNYSQIRIYVISGGAKAIDTLEMRTDQDTTLYAQGLRSDGSGLWDPLPVDWYNSSNMTFNRSAPQNSPSWNFNPIDTASGIIYITFTSTTTLRDTIKAFFHSGKPFREVLYPLPGKPNTTTNAPLPGSITITAGTHFQIVAKLFDNKNLWNSTYENTSAPFSWSIQEVQGTGSTGSLSTSTGFLTVFTPRKAYNSVKITASFQDGAISVPSQSIMITVIPGPPDHLVIEGDTSKWTRPNDDNPVGTVTIDTNSMRDTVYAVLRDSMGNWVGLSNWTSWNSVDPNKATVVSGNSIIGEGVISRVSASGQTNIIAKDLDTAVHKGPKFTDTALVVLSSIYYSALRIVVRDTFSIDALTMRIDQDTIIQVQGKRSDNGLWVAVPANWSIIPDMRTSTSPPQSANFWDFTPKDTGTGRIIVTLATSAPDTITFHFVHGLPYSLALYPLPGKPGPDNMPLASPTNSIIDTAGKSMQLIAKIFDKNGNWIGDYERSSAPINWNIQELTGIPPTGSITPVMGYSTAFTPLKAYNTVYIIATFDTVGFQKFSDSIFVKIVPGKPALLVIEENQDWQASPNTPRPVNRIQIDSTETYRYVYAIIRDALGNFINYSKITNWSSQDETVVTAEEGLPVIGQGVIKRVTSGDSTHVIGASGEYPGLSDTVDVIVLKYFYTALRIVVRQTIPIENLIMSTNDDTTLQVQGLRSDMGTWELVSARWENSQGLIINPTSPERSQYWAFSPVRPAEKGWIRVTLGNDVKTTPDTIAVRFDRGGITKVDITILTPPNLRIAGDTMIAVVKVYNKDGLIPDLLCTDTAKYQESIGRGVTNLDPVVIVDGSSTVVTKISYNANKTNQCFFNGFDTVKYVLYNATSGDTLQKLYVDIGSITGSSDPFELHPATLSRVAIQDYRGKNVDSVHLDWPNSSQVLYVVGYDRFGNKVVLSSGATWLATDSLHPIDKSVKVNRIYYDATKVKRDEFGFIYASVLDSSGRKISDSIHVTITGPLTNLTSAVTGDADGDGYLDNIVMHLDKEANFPKNINVGDSLTISYRENNMDFVFHIDSICPMSGSGTTDTVFKVYFSELQNKIPQTAWTPSITFNGVIKGINPASNFITTDGAGPVIWKVIKDNKSVTTNADDLITVIFSEPVLASDGSPFKTGVPPNLVFYVWTQDSLGNIKRDSIILPLGGIDYFSQSDSVKNKIVKIVNITMTNGYDISALNFFSIRTDSSQITDTSSNVNKPAVNNHLVRVEVISEIPEKLLIGPNPSKPTTAREKLGELHFNHQSKARSWVANDNAGTVINFMVDVSDSVLTISGYLRIYDVVGNPVQYQANDDILKGLGWQTGSGIHNYDIYWNQTNAKGMKVAPGNYFTVVYLTIHYLTSTDHKKFTGTVGVWR
jgi:fibro-slime domain-containing protein